MSSQLLSSTNLLEGNATSPVVIDSIDSTGLNEKIGNEDAIQLSAAQLLSKGEGQVVKRNDSLSPEEPSTIAPSCNTAANGITDPPQSLQSPDVVSPQPNATSLATGGGTVTNTTSILTTSNAASSTTSTDNVHPPPPLTPSLQQATAIAPQIGDQSFSAPIVANRTLYINNLNSKIKLDQLKTELRSIFENFGAVCDIIAMNSFWRRGQAWIIFADQESADKALQQLQGFPYSGKELKIQYARELSDIVTKEQNTFKKRPPGPKKPRAIVEREKKLQAQLQQFQQMMLQHMQQQQPGATSTDNTATATTAAATTAAATTGQTTTVSPPPVSPFPPVPTGIPPQLAALMLSQFAPGFQTGGLIPQTAQRVPSSVFSATTPVPPTAVANSVQPLVQSLQPQQSFMGLQALGGIPPPPNATLAALTTPATDMRAVPPPTSQTMSKGAMVAAAAAAAAQAVEAAAKKRAIEGDGRSPVHKIPRVMNALLDGSNPNVTSRFSNPTLINNPAAAAVAAAAAAAAAVSGGAPSGFPRFATGAAANGPTLPNKTLFVEHLPEDCDSKMLEMVFKQYPGCGEVRHVASRKVAFVDYETVGQASIALRYLNQFPIKEGYPIRVSYAKQ